ncbi:CubicO group peptidase (beta-lactamase class C family) [Nocardia tenerifensis]|uniref:CubicO group peptidase (Beta-lactamase class C family) n=1 Tax=Nocardia tenerifensis TaxID=228006 RepID=A0A318JVR8_9NOCA|nr:EstA family serine hydrolase [Nocardia tenerifensis]PXX59855.1 CubicO group peptidase (beta-lactamase class C family) [Nocardia tenerifensis]
MAEIQGRCADGFGAVADALAASLEFEDVGASAAVYVDGDAVVDLWGGYADAERTVAWERDTIVNVWSTTKTMVALCALVLADRGELDLDAPVADYWPEFAAAGKHDVLVRHLLGHTAGLPAWETPITAADLYAWSTATARLAAQPPQWEPGSAGGYHAMTFGHLVGEVVARVTGRSIGTFFAEEIAGPLGADFHIGLAAEHDPRVATLIAAPEGDKPAGFPVGVADANTTAWRRAEIPAVNGHGNARSVGAVQSVLACGGTVGGVRLLSQAGCERVFDEQFRGVDRVLNSPIRWGMGYRLENRTCSWGGWGGSLVLVDFDRRMTVAYVMNQVLWEEGYRRALSILLAAYASID